MKETKQTKEGEFNYFNNIEFWGRFLVVSILLSLTISFNTNWIGWVMWAIVAIVLIFWIYNLRRKRK